MSTLPHWDLTNVYPSIESEAFAADKTKLAAGLTALEEYIQAQHIGENAAEPAAFPASA